VALIDFFHEKWMDAYERDRRPWSGYDVRLRQDMGGRIHEHAWRQLGSQQTTNVKEMMGTLLSGYGYFLHFKRGVLWNTGSEHSAVGRNTTFCSIVMGQHWCMGISAAMQAKRDVLGRARVIFILSSGLGGGSGVAL